MAYRFGQFRKEQYPYSNYVKQLSAGEYNLTSQKSKVDGFNMDFEDIVIRRSFTTADGSMFLRFVCKKFTRQTNVTIKLAKANASSLEINNTQTIANIVVPAGTTSEELATPVMFDIVVTPNDTYGQLIFSIDRDGRDFSESPRNWIPAQTFMIQSFGIISNIVSTLDLENTGRLKQIGVQSRPGLEMCIDGEMIRVGRSGIYEINYGVDIKFVGFMPEENDHFIMDYQY